MTWLKKKSPQWNLLIEFFEYQMKNNNVLIFIFIWRFFELPSRGTSTAEIIIYNMLSIKFI